MTILNFVSVTRQRVENAKTSFASFSDDRLYSLNGEWEFYQDTLVASNNLDVRTLSPTLITLPTKDFSPHKEFGYVSYRIVVENIPLGTKLVVSLDGLFDGYSIYLNRQLLSSNHNLKIDNQIISQPEEVDKFNHLGGDLEIIIEISNYVSGFTGLKRAPILSSHERFLESFYLKSGFRLLLLGALLFTIIYQLIIIGFRNREQSSFYFALFILLGSVSAFFFQTSYSYLFSEIFKFTLKVQTYLKYLPIYLSTLFLFCTTSSLFNVKKLGFLDVLFLIFPIALFITTLSVPFAFFIQNVLYFNLFHLSTLVLLILCIFIRRRKKDFNVFIGIMVISILFGAVVDTLITQNIIAYGEPLSPMAFLMSVILYSAIINYIHEKDISNVQEVIELNKKIRDTEFTFLNSQIQSHFIYNTLNSIQSLCITNPVKASELIGDFSMYLRTRLEFNKMPIMINIEDEMEHIRTYLNIEKERYGSRINFVYNLQVGDFQIPPLTVQPLVENSVKHGISMKKSGGTITIATYKEKDAICILISDDGLGFEPKSLSEKQRVGTENIRDRLNLHLNATLTIESQPNKGTTSIIRIPIQQ